MPLGAKCQKELPTRQLSQLAARAQRLSDHVHCASNRQNGSFHGRPGGLYAAYLCIGHIVYTILLDLWSPGGLPLSRFGP